MPSYAEETRVVLNVFHHRPGIAQRVGGLKIITRGGHLGHQTFHPGVELRQAAVPGGAGVFTLNQLQVVRNARQQGDIRQTGIDAAAGDRFSCVIQGRLLG